MLSVIYRCLRFSYLRYRLRKHILNEQKILWQYMIKNELPIENTHYDVNDFEVFRHQYNLNKGQMGILLREIIWMPYYQVGNKYGIIKKWLLPLLEVYSDTDILCYFALNTPKTDLSQIQDPNKVIPLLIEDLIRCKFYLYVKENK